MPVTEDQAEAASKGIVKVLSKASRKAEEALLEGYRKTLKDYCTQEDDGFSYEDASGNKVSVTRPTERRLKGVEPRLDLEAYYEREPDERAKLMTAEGNKRPLVGEVLIYTEARAPSIKVDLVD